LKFKGMTLNHPAAEIFRFYSRCLEETHDRKEMAGMWSCGRRDVIELVL